MATYKVIQDIEAEDKLVGPLTLRQFIYAGMAVFCLYVCFLGITKNFPYIAIPFLPVALVAGFFAFPFGRDQPTEIWALAKIRFLFKPRRRIWNQSGIKELVTITAPKKVNIDYTNGLTENEVNSRLRALADTIDSRGWSVKNVNVNMFSQPSQLMTQTDSDRLIDPSTLPQEVPIIDIGASEDMLDENSSPIAQHFEQMITASTQAHRQQIVGQLQEQGQNQSQTTQPPNDYWFMNQPNQPARPTPGYATFSKAQVVAPGTSDDATTTKATPDEEHLAQELREHAHQPDLSTSHLRTLQPLSAKQPTPHTPPGSMTQLPDSVKMRLANDNNLSVAGVAHEAHKTTQLKQPPENEVIVPLH